MSDARKRESSEMVMDAGPLKFKEGDRVTRGKKHGEVVRVTKQPNIYDRLHSVRWDDGTYEDAFYWWGLRYE